MAKTPQSSGGPFSQSEWAALQKRFPQAQSSITDPAGNPKASTNPDPNIKLQHSVLPGVIISTPNQFEVQAGVNPPSSEGVRDPVTGELLSGYKIDPYSGEALQELKKQAFAQGPSAWANLQTQQQQLEQQNAKGDALKQQMQAQGMAKGQLARSGGLRGGAAALLARQGARDLMGSQQQISRAGMGQRLGIQQQDLARKEGLMGKFGDLETGAQQSNLAQLTGDINRKAMFDMERYKQQMQAWGAKQSADATRAAGGGGGKK